MSTHGIYSTHSPQASDGKMDPAASSKVRMGRAERFVRRLRKAFRRIPNFFLGLGKSAKAEKKDISDLRGRISSGGLSTAKDRLSDDHRLAALEILDLVKSRRDIKDFWKCPEFVQKYQELPLEIRQAFFKYLGQNGLYFPQPIATAGFFAAMSSQLHIREIVSLAQQEKYAESYNSFNALPKDTKDAYVLFLYKRSNTVVSNPENLKAFFSLLEIPEIQSEKDMTPNERNLMALRKIEKHFDGKLDWWQPNFNSPPPYDTFKGLEGKLREELWRNITEICTDKKLSVLERKDKCIKCIRKTIVNIED